MKKPLLSNKYIMSLWLFIVVFWLWNGCSKVPNNIEQDSLSFTSPNSLVFNGKIDSGFFRLVVGDTIQFSGIKKCSSWTNGIFTAATSDSVCYYTITGEDTILNVKGTIYGCAQILLKDVESWYMVLTMIKNDSNLFEFRKDILVNKLSKTELSQIMACSTDSNLTDAMKQTIVNAFNVIKDDLNFYSTYKQNIDTIFPLNRVKGKPLVEFQKLRNRGIFVDDNGTLKSGVLEQYEIERIKWFNFAVLEDIVYASILENNLMDNRIFPQITYRLPDSLSITNYLFQINSNVYQLAYKDANGFHVVTDSLLAPYRFIIGKEWNVTPLFNSPVYLAPEVQGFSALPVGKALVTEFESWKKARYMFFYVLNGATTIDGNNASVNGTTEVIRYYVYDFSLGADPIVQQQTVNKIEFIMDSGNTKTFKEEILMEYNPYKKT